MNETVRTADATSTVGDTATSAVSGTTTTSTPGPPRALPDAAPPQWHRGITVLAVISMFIGTRAEWTRAMAVHPAVGYVLSLCYAAILVFGVLTLVVRRRRSLARVDVGVLLLGIVMALCTYVLSHSGSDESVLTGQATHAFLHGSPVYGQAWAAALHQAHVPMTYTMSGSADYSFGYPPLAVLLSAPLYAVLGTNAITLVPLLALIVGAITLWVLLPAPWRSAATAVCLGFPLLPAYARMGYPAVIALALLIPVVVRWPAIGTGGRLGRGGVIRAVCLGAACAAQQLPWFVTPFLLVGLYAVRRGELGHRAALGVMARLTGVAALTWVAVNAYFIVRQPSAWLDGIALPITQHAVLHGQGIMGISYYLTNGSDRLSFYSYGSTLLLLGLLALFVVFVRRLGPAATVLPWCAFYLATRSQDGYYLLMTPLWLAAAATVPSSAFAAAWQPRLPVLFRHRRPAAAALAGALVAPAVACVAVAATASPPVRIHFSQVLTTKTGITQLSFHATNTSGSALKLNFAASTDGSASRYWIVRTGPATLAPHHSADYVLRPHGHVYKLPGRSALRVRLRVFTDGPLTVSSADVPVKR
ncbi:MAG: hypothetical protein QOF44_5657 [Streptomyces sp.]|nr:hypothetical protein [Streptomyces sp.]